MSRVIPIFERVDTSTGEINSSGDALNVLVHAKQGPVGNQFTTAVDALSGVLSRVYEPENTTINVSLGGSESTIAIPFGKVPGNDGEVQQVHALQLSLSVPAANVNGLMTAAQLRLLDTAGDLVSGRGFGLGELLLSPDTDNGFVGTCAGLYLFNSLGTVAAAMLSADTNEDDVNQSADNWLRTMTVQYAFNGASFDRAGTASSANLAAANSGNRAQLATAPGEWTLTAAPAANTQATSTRAAGAAGVRHVLRSICADLTAVAAITAPVTLVVRDGASGVGAILWQRRLTAPAGTTYSVELSGLNIVGSPATAMTVEFTAAPGATNFETISATGYSSAVAAS